MTIRIFAVTAAVLGMACSSVAKNVKNPDYDYDHTGAMWTQREKEAQEAMSAEARTASMTPSDALAASEGTGSQGGSMSGSSPSTGSPSGSQDTGSASGSAGSSDSSSGMGKGPSDSGSSAGMGQSDSSMGQSGTGKSSTDTGSTGSTASGTKKSSHKLSGKLSQVSSDSVTITPKKGEAKTLKISPNTKVTMNGKAAQPTDLKEGQQASASWSGEDSATQIAIGKPSNGTHKAKKSSTGSSGSTGGMGTDSMGGSYGGAK
jgi:hypothetical protein